MIIYQIFFYLIYLYTIHRYLQNCYTKINKNEKNIDFIDFVCILFKYLILE